MALLYVSIGLAFFIVGFVLVVTVAAVGYLIVGLCWFVGSLFRTPTNSNKEI